MDTFPQVSGCAFGSKLPDQYRLNVIVVHYFFSNIYERSFLHTRLWWESVQEVYHVEGEISRQEGGEGAIETKGCFSVNGKQYILFVERGIVRTRLYLFECKDDSCFLQPVPMKVTTSTLPEAVRHWLEESKRYLAKKRNKKRSQSGCSSTRNSS